MKMIRHRLVHAFARLMRVPVSTRDEFWRYERGYYTAYDVKAARSRLAKVDFLQGVRTP